MEEENNNIDNNNIEKKSKKVMKDTAKSIGKSILKKFGKYIIIGIGCLFGILLVLGLLHLVEYEVVNSVKEFISIFNTENEEITANATMETNDSIIYIDENGEYQLKADYSSEILKELQEHKVNNNVMGLNLDDEEDIKVFEDMIDKYIKAEVATTFPKTSDGNWFSNLIDSLNPNKVDGNITIKRAETLSGESILLEYVKYDTFKSNVEAGSESVLKQFSINPENFKLCIARKEEETFFKGTGASNTVGGGYEIDELEYRTLLQNYAVPLNYLITMHLFSQDVEFMNDLVELATGVGKEEPIVLTYVDSQQHHIAEYDYKGEIQEVVTNVSAKSGSSQGNSNGAPSAGSPYGSPISINMNNAKDYYDDAIEYSEIETFKYSGKLFVTKVDTWLKTTKRSVNRLPDEKIGPNEIQNVVPEVKLTDNHYETDSFIIDTKQELAEPMIEIEIGTIINSEFQVVETNSEIIIEEFIDLIKKHPHAKENLTSATSNIFYFLQQNENTQQLEKIMRYVMYRLNEIDYGVDDEDLAILLDEEDFIFVSGDTYLSDTIEEKIWVTLRTAGYSEEVVSAILGNIYEESRFQTNKIEDKYAIGSYSSLGHTSKSYTEAVNKGTYTKEQFISDNVGYGLLQWTLEGDKKNLYEIAVNSGKNIDDIEVQLQYLLIQLEALGSDWKNISDLDVATEQLCKELFDYGASSNKIALRVEAAQKFYEDPILEEAIGNTYSGETIGGFGGTLYSGTYTSSTNKTFTLLNQNTIPGWTQKCNRAAAAIIASGYTELDAATLVNVINTKYAEAGDTIVPQNNYFNLYGLEMYKDTGVGTKYYVENQSDILENLKSGGHAMIWMSTNTGSYIGTSGTNWTKKIHWVAILEYDEAAGSILVADHRGAGWYPVNEFKHGIWRYALIREKK